MPQVQRTDDSLQEMGEMNWKVRQWVMMPKRMRSKEKQWDLARSKLLVTFGERFPLMGKKPAQRKLTVKQREQILFSGAGGTLHISTPKGSSRANRQISVSKIGTQM